MQSGPTIDPQLTKLSAAPITVPEIVHILFVLLINGNVEIRTFIRMRTIFSQSRVEERSDNTGSHHIYRNNHNENKIVERNTNKRSGNQRS